MLIRTQLADFMKHYPPVQTPFGAFLVHFAIATVKKNPSLTLHSKHRHS